MTHQAKMDWWMAAAIAFAILVLLAGVNYWIAGPVLLVLLICAYPQSYKTTREGLLICGGLWRRRIPYEAITFVGSIAEDRVRIQYGLASELRIAPALDPLRQGPGRRCGSGVERLAVRGLAYGQARASPPGSDHARPAMEIGRWHAPRSSHQTAVVATRLLPDEMRLDRSLDHGCATRARSLT